MPPIYHTEPWGIAWEGPTPNPRWQRELDRLFPPGGSLESLRIYWEPGYPWQRVERWMIGTVMPAESIPGFYRGIFNCPNPGVLGEWDSRVDPHTGAPIGWCYRGPPITRRQWKFFRATGCLLKPYWVVQGEGVGHKYKMSRPEQVISRIHDGPGEMPTPGDLPYAEPDARTWAAIAMRDRVRNHLMSLENFEHIVEREGRKVTKAEAKALDAMRDEIWNWLCSQSAEIAEIAASQTLKPLWDNAPSDPGPTVEEREEVMQSYHEGDW